MATLEALHIKGKDMAWTKKFSPLLPTPPAYHHPDRCMNCGHLESQHDAAVGCLTAGGTKYIEDENGNGKHVCSCEHFLPAPEKETTK